MLAGNTKRLLGLFLGSLAFAAIGTAASAQDTFAPVGDEPDTPQAINEQLNENEQLPPEPGAGDGRHIDHLEGDGEPDADPADAPPQPQAMQDVDELDDGELPEGQAVEVGSYGQIDLHVKDLPLTQVLQLMSVQSQRNIIASRDVSGSVSADLYGVDFYEALDAILHANGFGYREQGNFIYVYTQEELRRMEEAERERKTRIVRLNYITASDAGEFVQPLLSENGTISISGEVPAGMEPTIGDAGRNTFAHEETLVIRDYEENIEQIMDVIDELDTRPRQVLVEATVLQAQLSEANAFGVDFAMFADIDVPDFASPLSGIDEMIQGDSPGTGGGGQFTPGNTGGSATAKVGYLGSDAAVFVRALDSVTDTTVLSTPKILALNRQRAMIHVGRRLGYLSTTATDTATTQTVEFLDIGTKLIVRPFISDDDWVRMELTPRISDGFTEVEADTIIPEEISQELTTNVMVRSGQTVVLGGLFKENTQVQRRQVPGLGDVPVLGWLGRGQTDDVERSEVIFLIKPTIMRDQALVEGARDAKDTIRHTRVGSRERLLPWSRTKLVGSHLQRAQQHLRNNEDEKALWHVNMALHLDPGQIDALDMKERITGERFEVEQRGILRDSIDAMIDTQLRMQDEEADDDNADDESDS